MANSSTETKQDIIDEVCGLIDAGPFFVGPGSSEPAEFFRAVASALGVDISGVNSKPDIARRIVEHGGSSWDETCDSRSSSSGGGSTVTTIGLQRVRAAVVNYKAVQPMADAYSFDVRPGIESLLTYRHHGYETWYALAELVDNSVASFRIARRDNPSAGLDNLEVNISFDKESGTIVVSDNAAGIQLERMQDALIAGRPPEDKSDLNQFGMGLKTAGFWFGSHLEIETFPLGKSVRIDVTLDVHELIKTGAEVVPRVTEVKTNSHGTRITIKGLWPERSLPVGRTLAKVRDYLASIYREDILSGLLTLFVGDRKLEPLPHTVLEAPRWDDSNGQNLRWEKLIEIVIDGKRVSGIVWLLARGDTANAGLVLSWQGKAIVGAGAGANDSNDSYRPVQIYGRSNSFVSQRLMGELDMSAFPVTSKKDGLEWSEDEQERFAVLLKAEIDREPLPLIKMATMYRKRGSVVDTNEDTRSALESIKSALEEIEIEIPPEVSLQNIEIEGKQMFSLPVPIPETEEDFTSMRIEIDSFIPGMRSGQLQVIYDPASSDVISWSRDSSDTVLIEINRASRFFENYSAMPKFHLEPTLRLCAALVIAEIIVEAGGTRTGRQIRQRINILLNGPLGTPRLDADDE